MANLTDADKVIRNDVGKTIASKLDDIADAIVQQGGGAHSLGQLSDVDIDTTTLSEGQSIVYNETTQKFENGEVSTVAALDDLTDVSITSAQQGDSLRNDGNGNWVNEPTTIEMTLAEWNAIADKQAWRNAHKNTHLVITDAPNLNVTAQDISYDGGADTVWDKVESIKPTFDIGGTAKGVNDTYQIPVGVMAHSIITIGLRRYAYGGEVTLVKENITAGAYTNGIVIYGAHDKYAEFTISTAGLITITAISNWAEVYIDLIGTF